MSAANEAPSWLSFFLLFGTMKAQCFTLYQYLAAGSTDDPGIGNGYVLMLITIEKRTPDDNP